ncbi:hypothetical protein CVU83_00450, partial [Candidatus Falkowbacteria bacterium HGW-Falkowbacteria-2]
NDATDNGPKEMFDSLKEVPYEDSRYQLIIDTLSNEPGNATLYGKLLYDQEEIWQHESSLLINAYGQNEVVLVVSTINAVGVFNSSLFFKGSDITDKAIPFGFPSIIGIRIDEDMLYLTYSDYGSFRRSEENKYASYNLLTGKLTTN